MYLLRSDKPVKQQPDRDLQFVASQTSPDSSFLRRMRGYQVLPHIVPTRRHSKLIVKPSISRRLKSALGSSVRGKSLIVCILLIETLELINASL